MSKRFYTVVGKHSKPSEYLWGIPSNSFLVWKASGEFLGVRGQIGKIVAFHRNVKKNNRVQLRATRDYFFEKSIDNL